MGGCRGRKGYWGGEEEGVGREGEERGREGRMGEGEGGG